MIIDIARLNSNIVDRVLINFDYKFSKEELEGTELISLECHIEGDITKNSLNNLYIDVSIDGVMVLPCAITLEPTNYNFSVCIADDIDNLMENEKKYINSIDIFPIIWENILMEIPMRVVNEKAKSVSMKGDGWKFITEDESNSSSPFGELKDLL